MARRRTLSGKPLLVATGAAGVALTVSCGKDPEQIPPPGNLMPPPTLAAEVCVDRTPADALITIDDKPLDPTAHCATVTGYESQTVTIKASAPGYLPQEQTANLAPKVDLSIVLAPDAAPPPPVGNLMPPPMPPPPPVGNLVAPPPVPPPAPPK